MAYSKTEWINNETKLNAANMNKIEDGIETNSNNMPTDINVDSNGNLILEHDGVEITGQKKKVKLEGGGTPVYKLVNTFFNSNWSMSVPDATDLATIKKCLQDALTRPVYLQTKYLNDDAYLTGPVYILLGYCYQNPYATVAQGLISNGANTNVGNISSKIEIILSGDDIQTQVSSLQLKTLFGKNLSYYDPKDNNIDLYKHYLTIGVKDEASNITDTFSILVQSSSNVDCSSATGATQKLKDLLKASGSSIRTYEYGPNSDFSSVGMLLWTGTILCITASGGELNIVNIVDRVETL